MRQAIERHGGTVEKFIGDAVMAVFGIPRSTRTIAARSAPMPRQHSAYPPEFKAEAVRGFGLAFPERVSPGEGRRAQTSRGRWVSIATSRPSRGDPLASGAIGHGNVPSRTPNG